jgi:uncharacterized protein with HEPN domain
MAASKSPKLRLLHIKDEIDALLPHIINQEREQFLNNYLLIRATERAVLIISEATRTLPDALTRLQPLIDWAAIRAIGNIIRHEYDRVEPIILWSIVQDELPKLAKAVDFLLKQDEA